jgi:hypothetical protein
MLEYADLLLENSNLTSQVAALKLEVESLKSRPSNRSNPHAITSRNNDNDRTTAIGLARYASEYFDAALATDEAIGERPGYETIAPPPVMFLVARSIELILKSYLRHCGLSVSETRNLNHSLVGSWEAAVSNGINRYLSFDKNELRVLTLISELHASTQLRYIQTGEKEFPVFGPLQRLAEELLNVIRPIVGYEHRY